MEKFAPRAVIFAGGLFLLIICIGFALTSPSEDLGYYYGERTAGGAKKTQIGSRGYTFHETAEDPEDTFWNRAREWAGIDTKQKAMAKKRASELRDVKRRQNGVTVYKTRTKGVLYNGS